MSAPFNYIKCLLDEQDGSNLVVSRSVLLAACRDHDLLRAQSANLAAELKGMTMLFRTALLSTTVEIAREAKTFIDAADAAIANATI